MKKLVCNLRKEQFQNLPLMSIVVYKLEFLRQLKVGDLILMNLEIEQTYHFVHNYFQFDFR